MMRTLARGGWVVVCGLGMAACSDGFFHDPAADSAGSRVAIRALQVDDGAQSAFDKADNLSVRVLEEGSGRVLYDRSLSVSADGEALEVPIDVDVAGRDTDAILEIDVRRGADDLFVGESRFQLVAGRQSDVSVALTPVAAGLDLPPIPSFDTFGQAVPLDGEVVFATGDPIPGATVNWQSLTPDVLSVRERDGGGFEAVALADGEGSLQAGFEATVRTVPAPVHAVVVAAEFVPSSLTLPPGGASTLQLFLFDAAGNPVPGRSSVWTSSDPSVVTVTDDGAVTAVGLGSADVMAIHDGVSALAVVTVRDPAPGVGGVSSQGVTANGATVVGQVDPKGLATTVWFEYGVQPDLSDGVLSPPTSVPADAGGPVPVLRSLVELMDGTTYYFRIIAENALGRTVSDIFTFTTLVAPDAPSGLTASRDLTSRIHLAWDDNSDDETRFEIERQVDGVASVIGSVGPNITAYVDAMPPFGTQSYRVRACNANGCSAWSDPVIAPPPGDPSIPGPAVTTRPPQVTGLGSAVFEAVVDTKGRVTSVQFEYDTDPALAQPNRSPVSTVSGTLAGSVFTPVTGLLPGATYYVRAVAMNAGGQAVGAILSFQTLNVPSTPTGLMASDNGGGSVRLGWNDASADEDGFEIERESVLTGQQAAFTAAADQTSFIDLGPPAGDLRYRVRACNVAGCSPFSPWLTYVAPVVPGPLVITLSPQGVLPDGADLRAFVDPRGAATTVEFQVGTDPNLTGAATSPSTVVAGTDPAGEVVVAMSGLVPSTQYFVRGVASNAQGQQQGGIVSFTTAPPPPPPAAPSAPSVTPLGAAGLQVDWTDNSPDETGFEVERLLVGSGSPTVIAVAGDVVQYTDAAPPAGLVQYRVRACNLGGCSAWSAPAQAYFGLAPAVTLDPITNISIVSGDATARVTPFQAATTVVFRVSTDAGFATSFVLPGTPLSAGAGATETTVNLTLTVPDDVTTYYVRAEVSNLWGTTLSNVQSFTTLGGDG